MSSMLSWSLSYWDCLSSDGWERLHFDLSGPAFDSFVNFTSWTGTCKCTSPGWGTAPHARHCARSAHRSFITIGEREWQVDEIKWNRYLDVLWLNLKSFCMYLAPAFPKTLGLVFIGVKQFWKDQSQTLKYLTSGLMCDFSSSIVFLKKFTSVLNWGPLNFVHFPLALMKGAGCRNSSVQTLHRPFEALKNMAKQMFFKNWRKRDQA